MITGNEPAMPIEKQGVANFSDGTYWMSKGLSIHQQFAAMAMQALISTGSGLDDNPGLIKHICKTATVYADSMIEALNEKELTQQQ